MTEMLNFFLLQDERPRRVTVVTPPPTPRVLYYRMAGVRLAAGDDESGGARHGVANIAAEIKLSLSAFHSLIAHFITFKSGFIALSIIRGISGAGASGHIIS